MITLHANIISLSNSYFGTDIILIQIQCTVVLYTSNIGALKD